MAENTAATMRSAPVLVADVSAATCEMRSFLFMFPSPLAAVGLREAKRTPVKRAACVDAAQPVLRAVWRRTGGVEPALGATRMDDSGGDVESEVNRPSFSDTVMSELGSEAYGPPASDRSGPKCREMFGGSGNSPLPQELSVLISAKRMSRLSVNWKRLCSKFCVSHRIRDEFGQRDHPIMCALVAQARGGRRFEPVHLLLRWRLCGSMSRRNSMTLAR